MNYIKRDYLMEAKNIIAGTTMMISEREHLKALNNVILELVQGLKELELTLKEFNEKRNTDSDK